MRLQKDQLFLWIWRKVNVSAKEKKKEGEQEDVCAYVCVCVNDVAQSGAWMSISKADAVLFVVFSAIPCFMLLNTASGSPCACVSAFYMRLFIYTHTRTHTRGNHSWHWQRESCRAKAPSGRVYLALTLDIPLNFAFTVHCTKLKAQVEVQSNIN